MTRGRVVSVSRTRTGYCVAEVVAEDGGLWGIYGDLREGEEVAIGEGAAGYVRCPGETVWTRDRWRVCG